MSQTIATLCAGASQGLVTRIADRLRDELGVHTSGRFGAVGAMKEAFLAGDPCDLMILTDAMIRAMVAEGQLRAEGVTPIGSVRTGVAVPAGQPLPEVSTAEALAAALSGVSSLWIPDTVRSTAGIHVRKVLETLGLAEAMQPRLREFPNGATAMRAMAESGEAGAIGCTQISEILFTAGVTLVAPLPKRFELGTVYTAAVSARAAQPALAQRVIALLASESSAELRARCGFE
jgi:molybdate transport system substrate-binding protein